MKDAIAAGTLVRIKTDPGQTGTTTGRTRERGDHRVYQVRFPQGATYLPDYELEVVEDGDSDVYDLLEKGRYGSVNDLRRNLTHIQLTGKLANLVYSMGATNTDFHAYQFKPVLAFLESPSNGLLIADEVGLGKTIEAGLIWTELRARFDARRLLVVCPAMLRQKWKDELKSKFSIDAEIVDAAELLQRLKESRASTRDGKALICSLQGVRPPHGWEKNDKLASATARLARFLDAEAENEPLVDMVIVDESHYMRNPETQNAKLGQLLRRVAENVVLLSATPVNLDEEDLYHQLKLVDPDFFQYSHSFGEVLRANEPLLRARDLALDTHSAGSQIIDCLRDAHSQPLLASSGQLRELIERGVSGDDLATRESRVRLANRIERINLLAHVVSRTRKIDVHELKVVRDAKAHFVAMTDAERAAYNLVTEAIEDYAWGVDTNSGFLAVTPQRQVASCVYAAARSWAARAGIAERQEQQLYEDLGIDDMEAADGQPLIGHLISEVLPQLDLQELRRNDSKYNTFLSVAGDYLAEHPDEKLVVFSYFPATLEYLRERLQEDGISSVVLHGKTKQPKQEVINGFKGDPRQRILLSSEVASEGVDLQFCRVLVNYDLPWNPMKVEQRIGRIDRLGQTADKISILNFGHQGTIDHRIYSRLLERLKIFERALGGMEAILGEEIQALAVDLLRDRLTPEQQEARIEQSAKAVENVRQYQEELERNASHMIAHGGYILDQVQAAHDFKKRITAEDLKVYVKDYLEKYTQGFEFSQAGTDPLLFDIKLAGDTASALDDYMRQHRLTGQSRLAAGDVVRCRFQTRVAQPTRQEEAVSQFHPLTRFISDDLRRRDEGFYPLVAGQFALMDAPKGLEPGGYVFAIQRWAFAGLKHEEHMQCRALHLSTGRLLDADTSFELVSRARVDGSDWLSAPNELDADDVEGAMAKCDDRLEDDYKQMAHEKELENSDRVSFQLDSAKRHRDREEQRILATLANLRADGKLKMIPATEGRLRKVRERFAQRQEDLQAKRRFDRSRFGVCHGVLKIT